MCAFKLQFVSGLLLSSSFLVVSSFRIIPFTASNNCASSETVMTVSLKILSSMNVYQAPYVTLLHTELGSGGWEGPLAHFYRRCNIEVFEYFYFFNITIEIARAYGKFSNLKIFEVMCMHLGCISKLS